MATKIQLRRGTAAEWTSGDTTGTITLSAGEIGFETDTGKFKIGDGSTRWNSLAYSAVKPADLNTTLGSYATTSYVDSAISSLSTTIGGQLSGYVLDSEVGQALGVASLDANGKVPLAQLGNLIDGAPAALDTLNELAAAINDDSSYASTITTALGNKQDKVSGVSDTEIGYLDGVTSSIQTQLNAKGDVTLSGTQTLFNKTLASPTISVSSFTDKFVDGFTALELRFNYNATPGQVFVYQPYGTNFDLYADFSGTSLLISGLEGWNGTYPIVSTSTLGVHLVLNVTGLPSATSTTIFDLTGVTYRIVTGSDITISSTELSHLDTVSSNIQTQLNSKLASSTAASTYAPLASPTFTGTVSGVTKSMVGLGNVDNTSDANKPVSTAQQTALDLKANLASPALTGTPTAPTAVAGTNTTQVATTAFVGTAVSNLVAAAPAVLDTLNELAAALGNDASFSTTITNALAAKAPLASPTFTGTVTLPGSTSIGNISDTEIGYLDGVTSSIQTQLNAKSSLSGTETLSNKTLTSPTITIPSTIRQKAGSQSVVADSSHLFGIQDNYWGSNQWTNASDAVGASLIVTGTAGMDGTYTISSISSQGTASITFTVVETIPTIQQWQTASNIIIQRNSIISSTEISYLDGATSSIQTQINTKAPLASPTFTGTVSGITKTMVGLSNVDNTSDANKPVSTATQTALDAKASLASPAFTGIPTAPTAAANTNTTQIATTQYVQTEINDLLNGAPAALDTLNELAAALNNDASYASTITTALASKASISYVDSSIAGLSSSFGGQLAGYIPDADIGQPLGVASLDATGKVPSSQLPVTGGAEPSVHPFALL